LSFASLASVLCSPCGILQYLKSTRWFFAPESCSQVDTRRSLGRQAVVHGGPCFGIIRGLQKKHRSLARTTQDAVEMLLSTIYSYADRDRALELVLASSYSLAAAPCQAGSYTESQRSVALSFTISRQHTNLARSESRVPVIRVKGHSCPAAKLLCGIFHAEFDRLTILLLLQCSLPFNAPSCSSTNAVSRHRLGLQ
jgi:hypothetical protein